MKVEIDIHSDTADLLIVASLKETLADMKYNLKSRAEETNTCGGFFSTDKEEDLAEMVRYIEAFKLTLSYFGVTDE